MYNIYIYIFIYLYTYIYIYIFVCVWADISRGMKFMWSNWRGILGVVRCRPQWILEPGNFDSSRIYTAKVIKYACTSTHILVYNLIYIYIYICMHRICITDVAKCSHAIVHPVSILCTIYVDIYVRVYPLLYMYIHTYIIYIYIYHICMLNSISWYLYPTYADLSHIFTYSHIVIYWFSFICFLVCIHLGYITSALLFSQKKRRNCAISFYIYIYIREQIVAL